MEELSEPELKVLECLMRGVGSQAGRKRHLNREPGEMSGNEIIVAIKMKIKPAYKLLHKMVGKGLIHPRSTGTYGKGRGYTAFYLVTEEGRMRYFNVKADEISKEFYSFNEMMERLDSEGLIGPYKEAVKKDERNYDKECNPIRQIPWDDKEGVRVSPIPAKEWGLFQEQRARIRGNFDEFVRNAIRIYQTVFQKGDCAIYVSPSGEMFKIDASDLKGVRMQDARLTPTVGDLFKYTK